jgi:Spy/CpxP family protein refolding chaperone
MKNKGTFWMVLAVVVIFAAGAVSGVFLDRYLLSGRHGQDRRGGPPSIEMMARDLSLTPDQQVRIREIFRESESRFKELRTNIHQGLDQIRQAIKTEIDSVLTPEQQKKFEAMIQDHDGGRQR